MAKMETKFTDLLRMDYDELVEHSKAVHKALRTKVYGEGYAQGKLDARMGEQFGHNTYKVEANTTLESRLWKPEKSQQEQRDEIVERAKADIDGLTYSNFKTYFVVGLYECNVEFVVNKEKRTIVAIMRGRGSGKIRARGIAKCAPNDCFNAHIGKAIALRRALGLDVPSDYLNVPQPTEVRVGDVISRRDTMGNIYERRIADIGFDMVIYSNGGFDYAEVLTDLRIIDDSREG